MSHWTPLPERPNVEYRTPREWTNEEANAYQRKQINSIRDKYSDKNYPLLLEMLNKTTIEPESNSKL